MSGVALYNALRKIPELSDAEAKEAIADVASSREVATKGDLAELETRLIKQIYAVAGVIIVVIIAAVGLMIKFL